MTDIERAREIDLLEADNVYMAKLLKRLRDTLALIDTEKEDEGGRVYFGDSNDADDLHDLVGELNNWEMSRIHEISKGRDLYAELNTANTALASAQSDMRELVEALRNPSDDMLRAMAEKIDWERNQSEGHTVMRKDGKVNLDASFLIDGERVGSTIGEDCRDALRAALAKLGPPPIVTGKLQRKKCMKSS